MISANTGYVALSHLEYIGLFSLPFFPGIHPIPRFGAGDPQECSIVFGPRESPDGGFVRVDSWVYYLTFFSYGTIMCVMGMKKKKLYNYSPQLPIDERIIPDVFSFSHVHGVARVFLITEMVLSTLVVIGTVTLVIINVIL